MSQDEKGPLRGHFQEGGRTYVFVALERLKELEWAGRARFNDGMPMCPACERDIELNPLREHRPDCWLDALIKGAERA